MTYKDHEKSHQIIGHKADHKKTYSFGFMLRTPNRIPAPNRRGIPKPRGRGMGRGVRGQGRFADLELSYRTARYIDRILPNYRNQDIEALQDSYVAFTKELEQNAKNPDKVKTLIRNFYSQLEEKVQEAETLSKSRMAYGYTLNVVTIGLNYTTTLLDLLEGYSNNKAMKDYLINEIVNTLTLLEEAIDNSNLSERQKQSLKDKITGYNIKIIEYKTKHTKTT